MKLSRHLIAAFIGLSMAAPVAAQDCVARGSQASVGASLVAGSTAAWVAHAGSELTVSAIQATAGGVEQGASTAVETSAVVTREALESAAVGVGTAVTVVADASGYSLVAAGRVIAYVPNEVARALPHRSRRR